MSLADVYEIGFRHALENIKRFGGRVDGDKINIEAQVPKPVRFEKSFEGQYPIAKIPVRWSANRDEVNFDFDGTGFVIKGDASKWDSKSAYEFNTQLYLDGKLIDSPKLPVSYTTRRYDLCWKYGLPKGKHAVQFKILNPADKEEVKVGDVLIYSDKLINGTKVNEMAAKNYSSN